MVFQYAEAGLSYICSHHDEISCKEKQIIIPLPALPTNYYSSFDYRTYGTVRTDPHHFGKLAPDPHQSGKGEA